MRKNYYQATIEQQEVRRKDLGWLIGIVGGLILFVLNCMLFGSILIAQFVAQPIITPLIHP